MFSSISTSSIVLDAKMVSRLLERLNVRFGADIFGVDSLLFGLTVLVCDCAHVSVVSIGCIAPKHGVNNINTIKRSERFFMINPHFLC